MILESTLDEVEGRPSQPLPTPPGMAIFASLLAVAILIVGILWDPLARASDKGLEQFSDAPRAVAQNRTEVGP